MKKRWSVIAVLAILILMTFGACKNDNKTNAPEQDAKTKQNEDQKIEGSTLQVLKYGTDADAAGLDPHTISAASSIRIFRQLYDALIDVDDNMNFIPRLAESWIQPDDVTYEFKLREGVKFHNGRELKAEDVKYSFERVLNPETGAIGKSYYNKIESIEIVDDYTVRFILSEPFAPFMSNLTSLYGAIVAKEVVEKNGDLMQVECGTGPFMLSEWIPDNKIILVKNEDYFIKDEPKLESIEYYVMTDESSRIAALRTGKVHMIKLPASSLSLVEGNTDINVMSYQSNEYSYIGFNLDLDKFKDVRVRQAINYAINREEIIDLVYDGEATISGFVPKSMGRWGIDYEKEELYQQNIDKAKQLMIEAGYPDGFTTKMAVGLYSDVRSIGEVLKNQLEKIGIIAEIENLESGQYIDAWTNRTHEMMIGRNGAGTDPNRSVGFFFSTEGTANVWGYSNEEVDKLCQEGVTTVDESKREEIYKKAQKLVLNDCPNIFMTSQMEYYFVRKELKNFNPTTFNAEKFNSVSIE